MGRQVNFYIMPEDLADLEFDLKAREDVVILTVSMPGPDPRAVDTLAPLPHDYGTRYLIRPGDLGRVRSTFVPAGGHYMVDASRSPVVEFSRGRFDAQRRLTCGRIYVYTWIQDEQDNCVKPDPDYLDWGDSLMKVIRKNQRYSMLKGPGDRGIYLSRRAADWHAQGGVFTS